MGTTPRDNRWLPASLAAIGFLCSSYLEYVHVRAWLLPGASSFCTVAKAADCNAVALSNWSSFARIPLPIWGAAGFFMLLVAIARNHRATLPLSAFAALASLGLLAIELAAIGSVCLFCEVVHVVSWGLLWLAWRNRERYTGSYRDASLWTYGATPAAGLLLAALVAVPPYWRVPTWRGELPFAHGTTAEGHPWLGSSQPKLVVEEWIDYNCPHCRAASQRTLRALSTRGNQIRLVRRNQPRMNCRAESLTACLPLRVAQCAGKQNRYWQMDRWLFAHWDKGRVSLEAAADDVGLDLAALKRCVEDPATYQAADDEFRAATKAHIIETPGYVIEGKRLKEDVALERIKAVK